ncbi:acyl carrier protein [Polymorphospora rubra]|uniref:Carrier domain-containing protein n=1 Tax=Polymorphospora rubra TaxID=338584 RepID=A0A810NAQ8_9ACTN|nr:acyl carrier protein [Polymorphospora rubra]BCJ69484.1 hypothetical protein Prubr_65050 [Polymorphospora rubra]
MLLTGTIDEVRDELQDWMCRRLAVAGRIPVNAVDPNQPMSAYGLDSLTAVAVLTEIEHHVGREVDVSAVWEYPTIAAFTEWLSGQLVPAEGDQSH